MFSVTFSWSLALGLRIRKYKGHHFFVQGPGNYFLAELQVAQVNRQPYVLESGQLRLVDVDLTHLELISGKVVLHKRFTGAKILKTLAKPEIILLISLLGNMFLKTQAHSQSFHSRLDPQISCLARSETFPSQVKS